jgi:putative membrane-bound dehydrogenase-like protein
MKFLAAIRWILPALVLGSVIAAPVFAPKPEARRLEVLFFGAPTQNGPHHDPITRYRALKKGIGIDGINLTYSENPSEAFTPENLALYDTVLMYGNWEQNGPMPADQLKALLSYVEGGGGFLPVHCASACYGGSPEFVKLVGARFKSHGGEVFQVKNVKPSHPILKGLDGFKAWDETYVHDQHGDDREILQMRDDEPWTWTRTQGKGRVFYTAAGHDHQVWDLMSFQHLLRNAIFWTVGPEKYQLLRELDLPKPGQIDVSLPGYRERKEITMAQEPLSPEESIKMTMVPHGMELSLFASEPDIVNPIYVNWDHRGRAYVVETIDYPNNLHVGKLGNDRITICDDTNGDGRADKFTRFATGLSIPTSLTFAQGGVLCTNGSQILFLKDTDGDDKADVRKVILDGFGMGDTHAGPSNLRYGFDGWIWATVGYSGFRGEVGGKRHEFAQAVFRFKPDGSELEVIQNTTNNTWGLGFTEEFDILGSTANGNPSWYVTLPRRDYENAGMEQPRTPAADNNPIFNPMSKDIRQVDQFDRYTAAAGHAFYTAERFPASYQNRVAFVCEPTGKLVGHFDMERTGGGWVAHQSSNNLYSSADAWSAPVAAEVGPDGAVWICDWYNLIIQHNPTPSKNSAGIDARNGKGNAYETPHRDVQHGRIYRVYPRASKYDVNPGLDPAKPATLIRGLDHPNLHWRLHAQQLLVEAGDAAVAPDLVDLVRSGEHAGPHALHVLAALGKLDAALHGAALESKLAPLRRAAIDLATPDMVKSLVSAPGVTEMDGRELTEVLAKIARAGADDATGAALHRLAVARPGIFEDRSLSDAWKMAARRHAAGVLAAAGPSSTKESEPVNLLPNPGFTEAAGDMPAGWTDRRFYGGAGADKVRFSWVPEGIDGSPCVKIQSDELTDAGLAVTVPVKPNTRYRLSGWLRSENVVANPNTPGILLNVHGGQRTKGISGTTGWTRVEVEFNSEGGSEAVIHCLFGGYGGARGTAWYDNLALEELGPGGGLTGALDELAAFHKAGGAGTGTVAEKKFKADPETHARGEAVYARTCIACHGVDGKGVPSAFPPIDGSDWLTGDAALPIKIVLHGLQGPLEVQGQKYNSVMVPLGAQLNDQQVADVLTFVRQRWTNDAAPVTADDHKKVRAETSTRTVPYTAAELGR